MSMIDMYRMYDLYVDNIQHFSAKVKFHHRVDQRQLFFPVSDNYNSRFIVLSVGLFLWANGMKP